MASGSPDWWKKSQINITAQDLDALQIRPYYTETAYISGTKNLDPGETDTLGTISGTGIILGGFYSTGDFDYHDTSIWYIDIDEIAIVNWKLTDLQEYGIDEPRGMPFYLLKDIPAEDRFYIGIQPGMTFESSCVFRVHNSNTELADNFAVYVWYALIP
jgi:hypothetical protein